MHKVVHDYESRKGVGSTSKKWETGEKKKLPHRGTEQQQQQQQYRSEEMERGLANGGKSAGWIEARRREIEQCMYVTDIRRPPGCNSGALAAAKRDPAISFLSLKYWIRRLIKILTRIIVRNYFCQDVHALLGVQYPVPPTSLFNQFFYVVLPIPENFLPIRNWKRTLSYIFDRKMSTRQLLFLPNAKYSKFVIRSNIESSSN